MTDINKLGLFFDELNKVRVLNPEAALKTKELDDTCEDFTKKINDFLETAVKVIETVEELAVHVDKQKVKALGTSNLLMSMSKQREAQRQQYQSLILEKTTELERLRTQHQTLLQTEAEQQQTLLLLQIT